MTQLTNQELIALVKANGPELGVRLREVDDSQLSMLRYLRLGNEDRAVLVQAVDEEVARRAAGGDSE